MPSPPRSPDSPLSSPNDDRNGVRYSPDVPSASTNALQLTGSGKPKKFACSQCGRAFSTSGHLARHIRIHTGERNHKCPFPGCETRCSRQDNLQQHYRIHLSPGSRRSAARDAAGRRKRRGSSAASSSSLETAMNSPGGAGNNHFGGHPEPPNTPPPLEPGRPRLHLPPLLSAHPQVIDRHPFSDQVYYHSGSYPTSRRGAYGFSDSEVSLSPLPNLGASSSVVDDASVAQRISSVYPAAGSGALSHAAYGLQTSSLDAHNHLHTSHSSQSMFSSSGSRPESSQILGYHPQALHSPPLSSDSGLSTPEFPTTPHSATSSLLSEGEVMRRGPVDYLSSSFSGNGSTSGHSGDSSIANSFATPGPYGMSQARPGDAGTMPTSSMVEHHRSTRPVDAVFGNPSCRSLTRVTAYPRKEEEFDEPPYYDPYSASSQPFSNLY